MSSSLEECRRNPHVPLTFSRHRTSLCPKGIIKLTEEASLTGKTDWEIFVFWAVLHPHPAPLPTSTCQITETEQVSPPQKPLWDQASHVERPGRCSGLLKWSFAITKRLHSPPWILFAAQAFPGFLAGQRELCACSKKIFFGELGRNDSTDQPLLVFISSHVITLMYWVLADGILLIHFYTLSNLSWITTLQASYYYHLWSTYEYRGLKGLGYFARDIQPVIRYIQGLPPGCACFLFLKEQTLNPKGRAEVWTHRRPTCTRLMVSPTALPGLTFQRNVYMVGIWTWALGHQAGWCWASLILSIIRIVWI